MPPETDLRKQELRRRLRAELRALPETDRIAGSRAVAAHLTPRFESLAREQPDATVALFASLPYEIATGPVDDRLRSLGLSRALPAYETGRLVFHAVPPELPCGALPPDRMGIPTPPGNTPVIALESCSVVIVPGLAFDDGGFRLGQGGGFYDRALGALPGTDDRPHVIGLCLDLQRVRSVPRDTHDVPVDAVCSPGEGLHGASGNGRPSPA